MPRTCSWSMTARRTARPIYCDRFRGCARFGIRAIWDTERACARRFRPRSLKASMDVVTLDCDGQHEPARIPELAAHLAEADIVSGSRYLKVFDPAQQPPEERRRINVEVTRWLNDCLGMNLTDAFCGFKAYRTAALEKFDITDLGYAMPLQVWVQAVANRMKIIEVPVELIYLDESRAFGGSLDDANFRLQHYRRVFESAIERAGLLAPAGCTG